MNGRQRIAVLFGGQSGEHEVSVTSAQSILNAIDQDHYIVQTVGISKAGQWFWDIAPEQLDKADPANNLQITLVTDPLNPRFIALDGTSLPNDGKVDLIFPVLHGPLGEDGTIQGLFEMAGIPYAGSGVLGSALGMDKDRMKAVFAQAGLPIASHLTFLRTALKDDLNACIAQIEEKIGYPCFIKPANLGSSVGITKAHDRQQLTDGLKTAAVYDRKIVVEENITGHEVEVSVLGNDAPIASLAGEILPAKEFYDYEAKYHNEDSRLLIPAPLSDAVMNELKAAAVKAYQAVDAAGLSRVDFFVTEDNKIILNEINTMPGFTAISMYPKLWDCSGIPYPELISRLIELGLERFQDQRNRKISYN